MIGRVNIGVSQLRILVGGLGRASVVVGVVWRASVVRSRRVTGSRGMIISADEAAKSMMTF